MLLQMPKTMRHRMDAMTVPVVSVGKGRREREMTAAEKSGGAMKLT